MERVPARLQHLARGMIAQPASGSALLSALHNVYSLAACDPGTILSQAEIDSFVTDGYIAIRDALPASVLRACQDEIWFELKDRDIHRVDPVGADYSSVLVRRHAGIRGGCRRAGPVCGHRGARAARDW